MSRYRIENVAIEVSENGIWFFENNEKNPEKLIWLSNSDLEKFSAKILKDYLKNSLSFRQISFKSII